MENKVITTPNGYTVTLRSDLTYGEYEDLQAVMGGNIKIDPTTGKIEPIEFSAINEANKKTADLLIVKIEKDGQPFNGTLRDMPARDGKMVKDEINKLTKSFSEDEESKKKEIA
jgi:hypothetical protein